MGPMLWADLGPISRAMDEKGKIGSAGHHAQE